MAKKNGKRGLLETLTKRELRELHEVFEHGTGLGKGKGASASKRIRAVMNTVPHDVLYGYLKANTKVIYGPDDRVEVRAAPRDPKRVARSVVVLIRAADLRKKTDGLWHLNALSFGEERNLCKTEPFREQPAGGFCSGFLIANDVIATAGHCVGNDGDAAATRFVFDFVVKKNGASRTRFSDAQVYKGKRLIKRVLNSATGEDWAFVQLDRPVTGRKPLKLSSRDVSRKDGVYVVGHPSGLPMKYAPNARVRDTSNAAYFVANLDTYGGNSGSCVLNDSGEVVGILVRGETDFEHANGCTRSKVCPDTGCDGEEVTKVSRFRKHSPKHAFSHSSADVRALSDLVQELAREVADLKSVCCGNCD